MSFSSGKKEHCGVFAFCFLFFVFTTTTTWSRQEPIDIPNHCLPKRDRRSRPTSDLPKSFSQLRFAPAHVGSLDKKAEDEVRVEKLSSWSCEAKADLVSSGILLPACSEKTWGVRLIKKVVWKLFFCFLFFSRRLQSTLLLLPVCSCSSLCFEIWKLDFGTQLVVRCWWRCLSFIYLVDYRTEWHPLFSNKSSNPSCLCEIVFWLSWLVCPRLCHLRTWNLTLILHEIHILT